MASPSATAAPLTGVRKIVALLVPWVFLAVFGALYFTQILPRATTAGVFAACVGIFVGLVFVSFTIAAVTFSRDVLNGQYP